MTTFWCLVSGVFIGVSIGLIVLALIITDERNGRR